MSYKKEVLDFLGITRWHELGYTGKGIKIISDEKVCQKVHPDVISPKGYKSSSGHGDIVMSHLKLVCPDSIFIAYPMTVNSDGNGGYKSDCADYIKDQRILIFSTSSTSGNISKYKENAMQDCIDKGCIFFASAGNDNKKGIRGEAKSDKYLAIGGVKPTYINDKWDFTQLKKVSYSSIGKELDYVTIAETLGVNGTSHCQPVFAGMCGLVQQFFIEKIGRAISILEMELFINDNLIDVDEKGFDIKTGNGLFILPEPSTIDIKKYIQTSEGIYYGGIPMVEDIKIKQMLLTPSKYTRPQIKINPTAIAWHYVGNPGSTALANRNYFEGLKDSHETKASSHYIIGLEGEIIQCIPDDEKSFCTNEANDYTISVECCHPDITGKFTEATYKSMIWLGRYLMQKHGIKNNIRHYDVTGKTCPKWFVDNPKEWEKFKLELEVEEVTRYKTVEEMPEYYRKDIQELIDRKIIAGRGGEAGLDLSDDMCRMAIYAKKIFEGGNK